MQKFELSPKPFLDQVEGKFYLEHLKSGKPLLALYLSQFWNWKLLGFNLYWNWNKIWFPTRKYFHPKFDSLQSWVHERWRKRLSVGFFWYGICFICLSLVQNCGGPDSFSLRLIVCMSSYAGNCTANRGPINLHLGPQSASHTSRLWLFWIRCKSTMEPVFLWII